MNQFKRKIIQRFVFAIYILIIFDLLYGIYCVLFTERVFSDTKIIALYIIAILTFCGYLIELIQKEKL